MSKKSYTDECLERAKNATEGPWKVTNSEVNMALLFQHKLMQKAIEVEGPNAFVSFQSIGNAKCDAEFIAHARVDVPELAKRLKIACQQLLNIAENEEDKYGFPSRLTELVNTLEFTPEGE